MTNELILKLEALKEKDSLMTGTKWVRNEGSSYGYEVKDGYHNSFFINADPDKSKGKIKIECGYKQKDQIISQISSHAFTLTSVVKVINSSKNFLNLIKLFNNKIYRENYSKQKNLDKKSSHVQKKHSLPQAVQIPMPTPSKSKIKNMKGAVQTQEGLWVIPVGKEEDICLD